MKGLACWWAFLTLSAAHSVYLMSPWQLGVDAACMAVTLAFMSHQTGRTTC